MWTYLWTFAWTYPADRDCHKRTPATTTSPEQQAGDLHQTPLSHSRTIRLGNGVQVVPAGHPIIHPTNSGSREPTGTDELDKTGISEGL